MRLSQKTLWVTLLICSLLVSTYTHAQKVIPVDTSHVMTLRIDPANADGGTAKELFESSEYIPLETTKESLFGQIDQLEITDEHFIILDRNTNSILFFGKDGKYQNKIKGGNKSNLANVIQRFVINKWKNELTFFLGGPLGSKYFYYDFTGKKLREVTYDSKSDPFLDDYRFIGPDQLVGMTARYKEKQKKEKTVYEIAYSKDFNSRDANALATTTSAFNYYSDFFNIENNFAYAGNDTTFFYAKPHDYNLYTVTPNTVSHSFKFLFPASMALPANFTTDTTYQDKRQEFIKKGNAIYMISSSYLIGSNLAFSVPISGNYGGFDDLVYNLKTGKLIAYKHISTDESSYFLPLFGEGGFEKGFLACDGKNVFKQVASIEMFRQMEKNKVKNVKYNTALEQYFSKGNNRDNPVILAIKFKSNL